MKRILIRDLQASTDQVVRVQGWAATIRNQKKMQFVVIRDHTGSVQATHPRGGEGDQIELTINDLTVESAVEVVGKVVKNDKVKLGQIEILPDEFTVHSLAQPQLPITDQSGLDLRLDWRFLDLRRPNVRLIFEIQTTAENAMREFWAQNGFIEMHSPKLMGSASESGAELFQLEYFGKKASLAQSPQFYKQMAMAAGFDRVCEVGPVFRANPSFTSRHDTEFTSVDMEISWVDSHEDVMSMEERWIHHVLTAVSAEHGDAIKDTFGVDVVVPLLPFPRVRMEEAQQTLKDKGHVPPADSKEGDLDPEGERVLSKHIADVHGHEFVFVTEYPWSVRPFYHMRHEHDPQLTKSFDLLWKGLEVTTGAQREHRYDILVNQAREKGIDSDAIQFYLDFFQFGCPPHGGFGFGLTRMLMVLLNVRNVREVTYLYRGPNRLTP
ncbi:aspartate--tRNA(Asn) ligase [Candidatus Peribacteria bacterium]|nr:aspartate--tRNA(Asn) ligase [Candidatus Peribacteria bacterium]